MLPVRTFSLLSNVSLYVKKSKKDYRSFFSHELLSRDMAAFFIAATFAETGWNRDFWLESGIFSEFTLKSVARCCCVHRTFNPEHFSALARKCARLTVNST